MSYNETDLCTAIHEAAHCVVNMCYGLWTYGLVIFEEDGEFCRGKCGNPGPESYTCGTRQERKELMRRTFVSSVAGEEAERVFLPHYDEWIGYSSGEKDLDQAGSMYRSMLQQQRGPSRAYIRKAKRCARSLIKRNWPGVRALANELLSRNMLHGREAEAIVRRALKGRTFPRHREAHYNGLLLEGLMNILDKNNDALEAILEHSQNLT